MRFETTVLISCAFLMACSRPPPAPEDLSASASFMVREFYADDATFEAGIQGFVNWFNDEGSALVGVRAKAGDDTEAFEVETLTLEDIAHLPLDAQVLIDAKNGTMLDRDPSLAQGVVSLAEMRCSWKEAEALLVRPDQDLVFAGDWEGYERDYLTPVDTFTDATATESFTRIPQDLEPFQEGFDHAKYGSSLLFTQNMVDPTRVFTSNIEAYPMALDLRHGIFDIDGEPTGVLAILTYDKEAAWGGSQNAALLQSYSLELNIQRANGNTVRMLTVWAEPYDGSGIIAPGSAAALVYAVNKSLASSESISSICSGDLEIEAP
jgi:hypothetical protein